MGEKTDLVRLAADTAGLAQGGLPVVLAVSHSDVGGSRRHIDDLARLLHGHARHLLMTPYVILGHAVGNMVAVTWNQPGESFDLVLDYKTDYRSLLEFFRIVGVSRIHYHHLLGWDASVRDLPRELDVPYDFTAHDYYSLCPRIHLMTPDGGYCGEEGGGQCRRCLEDHPAAKDGSIETWRANSAAFLGRAERVFAPSFDVAGRLRRHFPDANIVTAWHPEPTPPQNPLPKPLPEAGRPLVIAVLGAMSRHKGADTLEACARDAKKRGLPLSFELIGHAYRRLSVRPRSTLTVHGRYREQELQGLLRTVSPHIVWFPARIPETYSYTLSETLRSALPVVVPSLGAFPERIADRPESYVVPWDMRPEDINDWFMAYREGRARSLEKPAGRTPSFSYPSDYLRPAPSPAARKTGPPAPEELLRAARRNRAYVDRKTTVFRILFYAVGKRLLRSSRQVAKHSWKAARGLLGRFRRQAS
ncbi:MAG: glycosyltransferase family 4 protein [Desulfovibrio sp.]|nr:glycosyltransferase family 4 protein [Desulfovibrio sp.]